MEKLTNDQLTVTVSAHGAELQSIKDADGREYLWQADPAYWPKHSPTLFPIVCGLWKDTYHLDGKAYTMARHGFASKSDFTLINHTDSRVTYALTDSEDTLQVYPFHFNLSVTYRLDDNVLHVVWHVENTDRRELFFQIGGHPAFNVPGMQPGDELCGSLRLDNPGAQRLYGNVGGCIVKGHHPLQMDGDVWHFGIHDFDDDALVFDESQLHDIALLNPDGTPAVTVNFRAPAVGIWSPTAKNAPFICIEPWYGIHDWAEFDGDLSEKYLINRLQPGASFMSEYTITIG